MPAFTCIDHLGSRVPQAVPQCKVSPVALQIQGKDRAGVAAAGSALGLDGTYIARSYIEQVGQGSCGFTHSQACCCSRSGHGHQLPHSHCTPLQALWQSGRHSHAWLQLSMGMTHLPVLCAAATATCSPEAAAIPRPARLQLRLGSLCSQNTACLN